ncbi:MAG TPA: chemotaxis protein CheR, partial [Verrucomicrobiales bacterium]|nr:chemotaxis protein CheR [Verrucomicrobiales bacterium]
MSSRFSSPSDQTLAGIGARLRATTGLDMEAFVPGVVARAVERRLRELGGGDPSTYARRLESDPSELQNLVEEVVVPETWFFREPEAFEALASLVTQLPLAGRRPLRALSLPCSTGEEALSIAMTLLAAGVPPGGVEVDAVDISRRAIEVAERGVYGPRSFRSPSPAATEPYLRSSGSDRIPVEELRQLVRFRPGNLLDPSAFPSGVSYDFVFCRNLLIYLDAPARRQALARLRRVLAPGGSLFVAAAEARLLQREGLGCHTVCGAYLFTDGRGAAHPAPLAEPAPSPPLRSGVAQPPRASAPPLVELDQAMLWADEGRLAAAAEACREHLRQRGPSASAYYLLGLVCDADGRHEQAEEMYRKALYLDPTHRDALV